MNGSKSLFTKISTVWDIAYQKGDLVPLECSIAGYVQGPTVLKLNVCQLNCKDRFYTMNSRTILGVTDIENYEFDYIYKNRLFNQECKPCHPMCNTCVDLPENCQTCTPREFIADKNIDDTKKPIKFANVNIGTNSEILILTTKKRQCLINCRNGFYQISENLLDQRCAPCHPTCQFEGCTDYTSCEKPNTCEDNEYWDQSTHRCEDCLYHNGQQRLDCDECGP
jgi:hypothetical protein